MTSRKKPFRIIQLVAGISLNGKIAGPEGTFRPYSSQQDQEWLKQKIQESDVLIMGNTTYKKHAGKTKKPMIIFSRKKSGIRIDDQHSPLVHWFFDTAEELINLCNLLEYQTITVLGGAEIYHWMLQQKLLTDVFLTVEPFLFSEGRHLLEGGVLSEQKSWRLSSHQQLNERGTLLLHYQPF